MGPPTLRRHLGGPQLPSGGCKPFHPQIPITCWQRGEDQPLSDSHGPAASPKAPSPLTSSPSPAGARRPSGEQRRAPRMRARAPCRRRSLFLAACPGFLPHEQTLEKLVHSSRTTARASDKPRWLPATPGTEGPCSGCPWPPVPRNRVGNGMLSPSAGGGAGFCGLGDVVRGASGGQGFVTRCPGSPGWLSPPVPCAVPSLLLSVGRLVVLRTSRPDPIRPYAGCRTHPAPYSPRFDHHHRVTPDPSAPRAMVTEGTLFTPAKLPALCFWRQFRAEQPQRYCLGFYDQT